MTISPSLNLIQTSSPIAQGAEAKIYKGSLTPGGIPILIKHRFKKKYRHETLDATLTRSRVAGEARALLKCLRFGVCVPGIRMVDAAEGVLGLEWIEGQSVRKLLPGGVGDEEEIEEVGHNPEQGDMVEGSVQEDPLMEYGIAVDTLMRLIGDELAKMHSADIIHGDLTTSNMMLRHPSSFPSTTDRTTELVLIDFGLSYTSTTVEDKAVDLYVLERAFSSTHPDSEPLFSSVLTAYEKRMGRDWPPISRRLEEVRLRGRKRSMVG